MVEKELSRGAELYGRIVTGKGTYEDFFSFFATIGLLSTHSPEGLFNLYKNEWESYIKRS